MSLVSFQETETELEASDHRSRSMGPSTALVYAAGYDTPTRASLGKARGRRDDSMARELFGKLLLAF